MTELDYIKVTNKTVLLSMLDLSKHLLPTNDLPEDEMDELCRLISILFTETIEGIECTE